MNDKKILLQDQTTHSSKVDYMSYLIDLLMFVVILIIARYHLLQRFYAPFFRIDASEAFMQVSYYLEALRSNSSPFWDTFINLSTQGAPYSPIFSPVTLLLMGTALLFKVNNIEHLAYMFAFISYVLQVLAGFSMYLFLRYISLGRLAAIVGGIGYTYNVVTGSDGIYGIYMGYYRMSALAILPIVLICIIKLFSQTKNTLYYVVLSGFLLGMAFICNGDVKPTMSFVPVLLFMAYFEGYKTHGFIRTTYIFAAILIIAVAIASPQIYTTYEALQEGVKSTWNQYLSETPLRPDNTLLGFSQNTFSLIIGFLFPRSFFEFYHNNAILGITDNNYGEQRFGFEIALFILSVVGIFYKTKRHIVWFIIFVCFLLYVLGSSTPLWPIFGFLSEFAHLRYPTRTGGIVLYFLFSIYAAYGIDVIMKRSASEFYDRWYKPFIRYLLIILGIISLGLVFVTLQYHSPLFSPPEHTDYISLIVSKLFVYLLIFVLTVVVFTAYKRSESFLGLNMQDVRADMDMRLRARFMKKVKELGGGILNCIAGIVERPYFLKVLSFILVALFIVTLFLFYSSGFLSNYSLYRDSFLFINVYGIRLHKESLWVIAGLILGLVTIMAGYRIKSNRRLMLIPLFAGMVAIFLNAEAYWEMSSSFLPAPAAIFKKDVEFEPMYRDKDLSYYRIQIPHRMRDKLGVQVLGVRKSVYNYCCRQYMDNIRFSFGFDAGPVAMENISNIIRDKYDHPFWKLYNVKYIVDDFKDNPLLLPKDSNSYEKISDNIIRLKDAKPMVYFMEDFKFIGRNKFNQILVKGDSSILEHVYLHDMPEGFCNSVKKDDPAIVRVTDIRSGMLRASISTDKAGFLVFSEIWTPSWKVYIDGAEKNVLRAYGMLQAVQVDPGYHEIFFTYNIFKSWKMKAAIGASLSALIFIFGVIGHRFFKWPFMIVNEKIFKRVSVQYILLVLIGGGMVVVGMMVEYWVNKSRELTVSNKTLPPCQEITMGIANYIPDKQEKILLTADKLMVSSVLNATTKKDNLVDGNSETFWHITHPKKERNAFIEIDLGEKKKVKLIRVLPREGYADSQMWDGDGAWWEGSDDRETWQLMTKLQVNRSKLSNEWVSFILPEYPAFRHYRLKIISEDFLSLAELELYGKITSDVIVFQ